MRKLNIVLYAVVLSVLVLAPTIPAFAAILPNPTPPVSGNPLRLSEIEGIINQVARFLIAIALVIAVIYLIIGGIRWMAAAGDEEKAKSARKMILNGVLGAAVVLAVGVILSTLSEVIARTFFGS